MTRLPPPLATRWLGRVWRHLASCVSTSDEARAWAEQGAPSGAVVTADHQTGGRGQKGRVWHAPVSVAEEVNNLYYSVVLRPPWSLHEAPPLTLGVGVALCDVVRRWEPRAELKWPNDILVDGKKLAGVLTEARASGSQLAYAIVGIGCNLGEQEFAEEIAERATYLDAERASFAAALCESLEARYEQLAMGQCSAILADWRALSSVFGTMVRVTTAQGTITGRADHLALDGALVVIDEHGEPRTIVSGELYL